MNWRQTLESHVKNGNPPCLWWQGVEYLYSDLLKRIDEVFPQIELACKGRVVLLKGDFGFNSVATFFALNELGCISVPFPASNRESSKVLEDSEAQASIDSSVWPLKVESFHKKIENSLLRSVLDKNHSGLLFFSSASSGSPKAILHDFTLLNNRYENVAKKSKRVVAFLLFDHIGGINTMLMTLAMGGTLIAPSDHTPSTVFQTIRAASAQVLPCTPSFLRFALSALDASLWDLPSLEIITYGTEVMPQTILERLNSRLPGVRFKQTYGLTEVGVLPTRSSDSASTWLEIGDDSNQIRIRDGLLELKVSTSMVGYLNAPSPFTEDGWFKTGDRVEQKGSSIRILGRESEVINVGGLKVHPSTVEEVISAMPEVEDVVVSKESNELLGEIVVSHVKLAKPVEYLDFVGRLQRHCQQRLEPFQIPQKVVLHEESLFGIRFKRRSFAN